MWQIVADAAHRASDPAVATMARLRLAAATLEGGHSADVMDLLSDCVTLLERSHDDENLVFALYWLSACACDLDRFEQACEHAARGVALARKIQDPHAELTNLRVLGTALALQGEHERAVAVCEEALRLAVADGEDLTRLYAMHNLAYCCVLTGQYERAVELALARRDLSRDLGYISAEALSLGVLVTRTPAWGGTQRRRLIGRHCRCSVTTSSAATTRWCCTSWAAPTRQWEISGRRGGTWRKAFRSSVSSACRSVLSACGRRCGNVTLPWCERSMPPRAWRPRLYVSVGDCMANAGAGAWLADG
jgi:tetratricopeptide (TPR) repeat protein